MDSFPFIISNKKNCKKQFLIKKRTVLKQYSILSSTSKNIIHDIINIIFNEFCKLDVYGYNKVSDEFWGKKGTNLYFRLELKELDKKNTTIVINPVIGDEDEVRRLYNGIRDSIQLCENTFIR
jgi:hypothetical protein